MASTSQGAVLRTTPSASNVRPIAFVGRRMSGLCFHRGVACPGRMSCNTALSDLHVRACRAAFAQLFAFYACFRRRRGTLSAFCGPPESHMAELDHATGDDDASSIDRGASHGVGVSQAGPGLTGRPSRGWREWPCGVQCGPLPHERVGAVVSLPPMRALESYQRGADHHNAWECASAISRTQPPWRLILGEPMAPKRQHRTFLSERCERLSCFGRTHSGLR